MGRLVVAAVTVVGLLAPGSACADSAARVTTLHLDRVPVVDGGHARFTGTWTYETPRHAWRPTGAHTFRARNGGRCTARIGVAAVAIAAAPGSGRRLVEEATRGATSVLAQGARHRVVRKPAEDGEPQLQAVVARRAEGARWSLLQADVVASPECTARQLRDGALPRALSRLVRAPALRAGD